MMYTFDDSVPPGEGSLMGISTCLNKIESEKVHIYQTGKHTNVDERHTLIYDMTPDSYVKVAYALQDTRGEGFKNRTTDSASIDLENLRKKFPPLDGIF